jgi:hypothetical protein
MLVKVVLSLRVAALLNMLQTADERFSDFRSIPHTASLPLQAAPGPSDVEMSAPVEKPAQTWRVANSPPARFMHVVRFGPSSDYRNRSCICVLG